METNNETFITQFQLAGRWELSEWAIWSMRRRGELPPALRVCRRLRWRLSVIEEWEEKHTREAEEFDPVLCERAARALEARGRTPVTVALTKKKRGRPTKAKQIEQRCRAGGEA